MVKRLVEARETRVRALSGPLALNVRAQHDMPRSSNGLGSRSFNPQIGVRFPYGVLLQLEQSEQPKAAELARKKAEGGSENTGIAPGRGPGDRRFKSDRSD